MLYRYWQSEKYFKDVEGEVRAAFKFPGPLSAPAAELQTTIKGCNAVSLAVRRSDYTSAVNVKQFGSIGVDYYERAMPISPNGSNRPHFFIFSDDVPCARRTSSRIPDNLRCGRSYAVPGGCGRSSSLACKHQIIPNSTFWWWGAWLIPPKPQKIVVAPQHWLAESDHDECCSRNVGKGIYSLMESQNS